jgi:uncharacterized membrane protein YphA (DoxX/SURF4 family)
MAAWWIGVAGWVARVVAAAVLAQTLYFKFTYAPETAHIFEPRGGRPAATLVGALELVAAVLLLVPRTPAVGAALALGLMGGAIATHLTSLGIEVRDPATGEGDGGLLFALAGVVAGCSAFVLALHWRELPLGARFLPAH